MQWLLPLMCAQNSLITVHVAPTRGTQSYSHYNTLHDLLWGLWCSMTLCTNALGYTSEAFNWHYNFAGSISTVGVEGCHLLERMPQEPFSQGACTGLGHGAHSYRRHTKLWNTLHTFILWVDGILEKCSGAKVYQLDAPRAHVYEDVLILDVTVDHPLRLAVFGGL